MHKLISNENTGLKLVEFSIEALNKQDY